MIHGCDTDFATLTKICNVHTGGVTMHTSKNKTEEKANTHFFAQHQHESLLNEVPNSIPILPHSKPYMRVLIIDDDADLASAVVAFIQASNNHITCDIATEPYEALLMLSDEKYDMILVDQKIPGLYGTDLLKKIDSYIDQDPLIVESGHYDQLIPIVLMSGSKVELPHDFKLNNFHLETIINKQSITDFLTKRFVN